MNIHKLTYVKVDEFFIQPPSKYVDFYGKQISSLKELQSQPRTIWFTRPFITTDPSHEILLLDGQRLRPAHFPDAFQEKKSDKFLWVSDLHCSEKHSHFPKENSSALAQKDFSTALKKSFDDNEIGDIAGVIVSGDITWQADPTEFSMASKIFSIIKSNANLNWYDFCVCPGNHDIAFSDSPAEPSTPVKYSMDEARLSFDDHYKELFYLKPNLEISSGRKFLLGNLLPVEIAMFNSSLLQQEKGHFQGHGFIGDKQLDLVASSMGWDKSNIKSHGYRIAVVHHHVMPVSFRDIPAKDVGYSVLLDAEAFTRWVIDHRVDLVLHGHMHQPFHTRIGRLPTLDANLTDYHEFDIVGLGSSGVSLDHVGEVGHNTFAILDFTTGKCVIDIYSLDPINPSKKLYTISLPRDSS